MAKKKVRRFSSERIAKMSARDINRITDDRLRRANTRELRDLTQRSIQLFLKRQASIEKAGLSDLGFAQKYLDEITKHFPDESDRNQYLRNVTRFREYFSAKTSTAKGIKQVLEKEEKRLSDYAGQAIRFNADSRKNFWSAYTEFMHQHSEYNNVRDSDFVQQVLAEMNFWKTRGFTAEDLEKVLQKTKERNTL